MSFVQIEPYEGEIGSESMEVKVLYDNENIYFGFTCFDTEISKLVANEMRRDFPRLTRKRHCVP